mmetsp:Transcript_27992/g.60976  ORF Transcript_27992/g.60976 Transcript_27992/m.60976 type:complete len:230 (+) Transcript_27992:38-727(+)
MTSSNVPRFLISLLLTCLCGVDANNSNYLRAGAQQVASKAGVSLTDDSRQQEKKNDHENFPPIPPFPKPTKDGIGFTRKISQLDSNTSFSLTFGGGRCRSKDEYGNNSCHYNWGDAIEANYTVKLGEPLQEEDTLQGHVKIDHLVPYSFSCAVCGADCVLKIPVANIQWSFPTKPCPISTDMIVDTFTETLGDKSPTDGIPVHIEGNLKILRAKSGDAAASFSVSVDIK